MQDFFHQQYWLADSQQFLKRDNPKNVKGFLFQIAFRTFVLADVSDNFDPKVDHDET